MASILPALRQPAPRLTRQLFQCSHYRCPTSLNVGPGLVRKASPRLIRSFASSRQRASVASSGDIVSKLPLPSSLQPVSKSISHDAKKVKTRFFPSTSEKGVAYWLLGSAASVFGIVVFGGLTRLTESGYVVHCNVGTKRANGPKAEYHRMEACNGEPTTYEREGLGFGVRQISIVSGVQAPQPTHDPIGI